jgi:hypothetical protein
MSQEFLAQTLNSRELLALLFICERNRKKQPVARDTFASHPPGDWTEIISTFAERLANLGEAMRFEVLEAHLMSVEDVDVYNNETLGELLNQNRDTLEFLSRQLSNDQRFLVETK